MAEPAPPQEQAIQAEIARLNKVIQALMNRAERAASLHGSDFNLFQTAITLEDQVRRRTGELEAALSENERITRNLREREIHYRLLLENSPVSIHEIDMEGRVLSMSPAGLRMHGVEEEGEVRGTLYLDGVAEADRLRVVELLDKAFAGEISHFEFSPSNTYGRLVKSCFVPIRNVQGTVERLMGITEDITERKKAEEQVRALAFLDTLTQLPNRRLLTDRLGQAMAASKRSKRFGAMMFLDLDNFKSLNDLHGHEAGDLLLVEVAQRLLRCVREVDTVARMGGDEFVVMLGQLDVDEALSIAQAGTVAEKIRSTLAQPYLLRRKLVNGSETTVEHHCTSSIGVVLFHDHAANQEDVLKRADVAMYQAKESGRNRVHFVER